MSKKQQQQRQQREAEALRQLQSRDGGRLVREAEVVGVDVESRTVELAFSSEVEVERWFGIEILSHDADAVDLSRLNNGGAVLAHHDWEDQRGVVLEARIDSDRKGRAKVKISRSVAGEELLQDIVDGIRRHVSVGYFVKGMRLVEERDGVDVYVVNRWLPYEISFVPIPADVTVGVGRSADIPAMARESANPETSIATPTRDANPNEETPASMKIKTLRNASGDLVRAEVDDDGNIVREIEVIERASDGVANARAAGQNAERDRVRGIADLARNFGRNVDGIADLERTALAEGHSPEQFQRTLLEKLNERANKPLNEQVAGNDIGLTEREIQNYSLVRVVRALIDPTDKRAQREAAFEFAASEAARANQATQSDRFVIPTDVLRRAVVGESLVRAPLAVGSPSTGGNLVATDLQPGSFVDILRNVTTVMRRGRVLGGLVGNLDIPKKASGSQGYWLNGEDTDATETGMTLGQFGMSPKTVAGYTEVTRKMIQQSSLDIEALLRADIAAALGLTIDLAGYYGTGTNGQPIGIANVSGINAKTFADEQPTFAELVDMETEIGLDNADVSGMSYVGNAAFRGHCKKTEAFTGTGRTLWEAGGTVNGYSTEITNQVQTGDVFLCNFADLIIGMWGGLELNVDPYTHSTKGRIRIVAFQDVDFAVRRAASFCLGRKAP